jgi:hypothetical protein
MRLVDLLHRWMGGLISLIFALLAITGTLLLHADQLFRPAAGTSRNIALLSGIVAEMTRTATATPDYVIFSSADFFFHRVVPSDGSGH